MKQLKISEKNIQAHPSMLQALQNRDESIVASELELKALKLRMGEIIKKIDIAKKIDMSPQGLKNRRTRIQKKINQKEDQIVAYNTGYIEIPNLDRNAGILDDTQGEVWWKFTLSEEAPLRVFEAVLQAKNLGIFKEMVVYNQKSQGDPIIAGVIGDRRFFISSWR